MPKISVTVEITENSLASEIVPAAHADYSIPGIGILTCLPTVEQKSIFSLQILEFVLTFSSGVASGVLANWLYAKIRGRVSSLAINRIDVRIDEGEIKRVIEEQITLTS